MKSRLTKCLIFSIFLLTLSLISYGCFKKTEKNVLKPQVVQVTGYKVGQPKVSPVELTYPGRTKSISSVTVVARITGILQKQFFKEGEFVSKGRVLFLIEPDLYQAAYQSAKANLEKIKAELEKAEKDWKRISTSFKDRLVSEQEKDAAWYAYQTAKANLKYAEAQLKQAEINLSYTQVKAPTSGITGQRLVDIGNLVNPGTPLVTITVIDPMYVEFSIPDRDLLKLGVKKRWVDLLKNTQVILLIEDRPYKYPGKIDFVDTVIDEKTSSVKVRAVFKNPEKIVLPNQFVRVTIKGLKKENVILIPQKAVFQGPTGPIVWVIENDKALPRPVKLGETYENYVVIEEGLKPGEIIVVDNLLKLRPGISVRVEKIIEE